MSTTVLLTGYEPFSAYDLNPSSSLAEALDGAAVGPARLVTAVMPVDLRAMPDTLARLLDDHQPRIVLGLGLAVGAGAIAVERVAINLADLSVVPDNAGLAVADVSLVAGGPAALFATVPTRPIVEALRSAGIPAHLSYSAGTHLCNAALYHTLYTARARRSHMSVSMSAGFLHLPLLPEQAASAPRPVPSMALETMRRAVEIAVTVCCDSAEGCPDMRCDKR